MMFEYSALNILDAVMWIINDTAKAFRTRAGIILRGTGLAITQFKVIGF